MGMGEAYRIPGCLRLGGHPGPCEMTSAELVAGVRAGEPPQVAAPHTVDPANRTISIPCGVAGCTDMSNSDHGLPFRCDRHVRDALDASTLDPGIRRLVMHLRALGIPTTDSGDGVSKPADERVLDVPHVFAVYSRNDWRVALADADRVLLMIPASQDGEITLSYSPRDQRLVLAIIGYGDADLPGYR